MPTAIQVKRSQGSCTPYMQLVVASATNYDIGGGNVEEERAIDHPELKVVVHRLEDSESGGRSKAALGGAAEEGSGKAAELFKCFTVETGTSQRSARGKSLYALDDEEMNKRWDGLSKIDRPYSAALKGEAKVLNFSSQHLAAEEAMDDEEVDNNNYSTSGVELKDQMRTSSASAAATDRDEPSANDASRSTQV